MPIFSAPMAPNPWTRELELQRERVWGYFQQIVSRDFAGSERPWGELAKSLVYSGIAMERVLESAACRSAKPFVAMTMDSSHGSHGDPVAFDNVLETSLEPKELAHWLSVLVNVSVVSSYSTVTDGVLIQALSHRPSEMIFLTLDDFMAVTMSAVKRSALIPM
jgi:hypothetical protein